MFYSKMSANNKHMLFVSRKAISNYLRLFLTQCLFFLFTFYSVFSQNVTQSEAEIKQKAFENLEQGNYDTASVLLAQLVELYPKDPEYNYYCGVSFIEANLNIENSIRYLEFASTKVVPYDVYYYLGLAYHLTYQFDEAIAYYSRFKDVARKPDLAELNIDRLIEMAGNGKDLIKSANQITVLEKMGVAFNNYYINYHIPDLTKRVIEKSIDLKSKVKDQQPHQYFQTEIKETNIIYFSSYWKDKKQGKDIFRIVKFGEGLYSEPENLGPVINTLYDEDFVYFDDLEGYLYFCSKGHNSIGGFDIFRSEFDKLTQSWSEPENMDFPVNSPFNDYLLIPNKVDNTLSFASVRESGEDKIFVYKIQIEDNPVQVEYSDLGSIVNASKLEVGEISSSISDFSNDTISEEKGDVAELPVEQEDIKTVPDQPIEEIIENEDEYNKLLNEALLLQVQADSILRLANEKRSELDNITNNEIRSELQVAIVDLEEHAYDLQRQADEKYAEVRSLEEAYLENGKDFRKIEEEEEISPVVSENKETGEIIAEEEEKIDEVKKDNGIPGKETYTEEGVYVSEFSVLTECPFSDDRPIPVDSEWPDGLIYTVQCGAFSKQILQNTFGGLSPVFGQKSSDGRITRYFVGIFRTLKEAEAGLSRIKASGFKDAFFVVFHNNQRITMERAKNLKNSIKNN